MHQTAAKCSNSDCCVHQNDVYIKIVDSPATKSDQVTRLLEQRIQHGDYLMREFPTDRQLSTEFQVDTRTARKAVARLIESGLLIRQANGRPAVKSPADAAATLRIAMLSVAYPSPYTWRWQRAISELVVRRMGMFRPVTYVHTDDAIVGDTLEGFDGIFFGPSGNDPTPHLLRTVERAGRPTVFLDADLSAYGYPSLWLTPPTFTTRLLEHLAEKGHRRIACLNTQAHNAVTETRLDCWRSWTLSRGMAGRLIDDPAESFGSPVERAYLSAKATVANGGFDATALLCCTSAAAKGVYRALHEAGLEVGRDLAVCSADDGVGEAPFFIPSLTSLADPDPLPYVATCLDWMQRGGRDWHGPLLVQPKDVPLVIGESTSFPPPGRNV